MMLARTGSRMSRSSNEIFGRSKILSFLLTYPLDRPRLKGEALKLYLGELKDPTGYTCTESRAMLRAVCRDAVLDSSKSVKRKYDYTSTSSILSLQKETNHISALRQLQQERLIVTRLGFPEKAQELDKEIEKMRVKATKQRKKEEAEILSNRMRLLAVAHQRREAKLKAQLDDETRKMEEKFAKEKAKLMRKQQEEFLRLLEGATRRALGRVKKCNCRYAYLCRHNKTASYNTRRPLKIVVQYRRNAKRLKAAG